MVKIVKDISLLTWLTQLGLSVALPLCGFVFLAVWLRNYFDLGNWVVFVGAGLGLYCSATGFLSTLRALSKMAEEKETHSVSFNEHR